MATKIKKSSTVIFENIQTFKPETRFTHEQPQTFVLLADGQAQEWNFQKKFIIEADAQVKIVCFYLGSINVSGEVVIEIQGNAKVEYASYFFSTQKQIVRLKEKFIFEKPGSYGRFLAEGVAAGSAETDYTGNIIIRPGAQQTDSRLEVHSYILGDEAKCKMIPELQIEANNVKAGHAATVAKIDTDQLFYLRSRGLKKNEATQLFIEGIFLNGIGQVSDEKIQVQLQQAVRSAYESFIFYEAHA